MYEIDPSLIGANNLICMTKHNTNFAYMPIPKNASSYNGWYFTFYGWKLYQCEDMKELQDKKKIVVLRDPFERFFSGMAQDLTPKKNEIDFESKEDIDKIFCPENYELHVRPQISYLSHLEKQQCYFLKLDHTYNQVLGTLTKNKLKYRQVNSLLDELGGSDMDYSIKEKIKTLVNENRKYFKIVSKFLEEDLELFNSTYYYKG